MIVSRSVKRVKKGIAAVKYAAASRSPNARYYALIPSRDGTTGEKLALRLGWRLLFAFTLSPGGMSYSGCGTPSIHLSNQPTM